MKIDRMHIYKIQSYSDKIQNNLIDTILVHPVYEVEKKQVVVRKGVLGIGKKTIMKTYKEIVGYADISTDELIIKSDRDITDIRYIQDGDIFWNIDDKDYFIRYDEMRLAIPYPYKPHIDESCSQKNRIRNTYKDKDNQLGVFIVHPLYNISSSQIEEYCEMNTKRHIGDITNNQIGAVCWEICDSARIFLDADEIKEYREIPDSEMLKRIDKVKKEAYRIGTKNYQELYRKENGASFEIKDYIKDSDNDDEILGLHTAIMKQFNNLLNQIKELKLANKNELYDKVNASIMRYIGKYEELLDNEGKLTIENIDKLNAETVTKDILDIELEIIKIRNKYGKLGNILEENEVLKQKIDALKALSLGKTI